MIQGSNGLPVRAVQVFSSASGAAQDLTVTMPAVAGYVNVLTALQMTGGGATVALGVDVVFTGCVVNPKLRLIAPAGALLNAANTAWSPEWENGLPASGPNVAITVTLPSLGLGNLGAAINLIGYRIPG